MFKQGERTFGNPAPAFMGAAHYGEDWNPGPIDHGDDGLPIVPTAADRQAAMDYERQEIIPQRKDCLGVIMSMTWTALLGWAVLLLAFFGTIGAICGMLPYQMKVQAELEAKQRVLYHEEYCFNATLRNQTVANCTATNLVLVATELPRFWDEASTPVPTPISTFSDMKSVEAMTNVAASTVLLVRGHQSTVDTGAPTNQAGRL